MSFEIRWTHGDASLQRALEPVLLDHSDALGQAQILFERPGRKRHSRVRLGTGDELFVKRLFARRDSPHRRFASALGFAAAEREWRALVRLRDAGVAVPEPMALGVLPGGDHVLATRYHEGPTLKAMLPGSRSERVPLLVAVGQLVARLHAAGYVHRDLHWGNILVSTKGPLLLDLQAAWPSRSVRARQRDLGVLDFSLTTRVSTSDRVRLRCAALGFERPLEPRQRRMLRTVGRASEAQGRAYASSRTRRCLQPGRAFACINGHNWRGMRARLVSESEVMEAIRSCRQVGDEASGREVLKSGRRSLVAAVQTDSGSWIVKDYHPGGRLRRAADLFRGSPARRAWRGGYGLRARNIGAARPIAFVEQRRWGTPVASAIVLEDLRALEPADRCSADWADDRSIVNAIIGLAISLHRRGVIHGDLKSSHVLLARGSDGIKADLIDLEGVRFRRSLRDRARIQALAELNASLPDSIPNELRHRAFLRYSAVLPFRCQARDALRRIVAISLARRHRWTGLGCEVARELRGSTERREASPRQASWSGADDDPAVIARGARNLPP
jgi:tRNA A-37 threonylcarbamoyl transferase component Bud32